MPPARPFAHRHVAFALTLATAGPGSARFAAAQAPREADDKQRCVAAYGEAQRHRRSAELVAARDKLLVCARASCPAASRNDCTVWLDEVTRALPSIVLVARARGEDVSGVEAFVDGRRVERLDGKALELDPGPHEVRFAHGGRELRRQVVVHEGEKLRPVAVDFDPAPPPPRLGVGPAGEPERPVPVGALVLGGAGLAALGGTAFFWLRGKSIENDLADTGCDATRTCASGEVERAENNYLRGDVLLGVGAAALAGAGLWYLLRPTADRPAVGLNFAPTALGQGAKGGLWLNF